VLTYVWRWQAREHAQDVATAAGSRSPAVGVGTARIGHGGAHTAARGCYARMAPRCRPTAAAATIGCRCDPAAAGISAQADRPPAVS
jgi:hypothetical protein